MDLRTLVLLILQIPLALLPGCNRAPPPATAADEPHEAPPPTDRIAVPEAVRRNLGITFARVESRAVTRTLRVPGRFELLPEARREYRTVLGGRVTLRVSQYQRVAPGDVLFVLDSPAWHELQERMNETESAIQQAAARVAAIDPLMEAHRNHERNLQTSVAIWEERVAQLERAAVQGVITAEEFAQARAALASARAELSEVLEKEAELEARRVEVRSALAAARERFELLLMNAASLLALPRDLLTGPAPAGMERHVHVGAGGDAEPHGHALWRELQSVEVRAAEPGVVEALALTNGAWASETSLVLSTVQPERVRFRARGLQSDLGRLRDGLAGTIVPPRGGTIPDSETMRGEIRLGIAADAGERTVEVLMTPAAPLGWARPGVSAHLEIVTEGEGQPELAIPLAATIRDGLRTIFFRRDPQNPDQVIRVEADLGLNDGAWVVVHSGVKEGDEVVLDGVYQLMLASSPAAPKAGHFHADGTFHEGEH
jgi:hypothetical protein